LKIQGVHESTPLKRSHSLPCMSTLSLPAMKLVLILLRGNSFFTLLSMLLQHNVWVDERVVVAYDNGRLDKSDPTQPSSDAAHGPGVTAP
jgi:hypothetical protein